MLLHDTTLPHAAERNLFINLIEKIWNIRFNPDIDKSDYNLLSERNNIVDEMIIELKTN